MGSEMCIRDRLIHTSNAFHIESQEKLAKRLCQLTGMENVFFCNSGAESVEAAIKIASKYGHDKEYNPPKIIVMSNSFHGRTMGAMSATSSTKSHDAFGPILDGLIRVEFNKIEPIIPMSAYEPFIPSNDIQPDCAK